MPKWDYIYLLIRDMSEMPFEDQSNDLYNREAAVQLNSNREGAIEEIKKLGREGWELVSSDLTPGTPANYTTHCLWFKREIEE